MYLNKITFQLKYKHRAIYVFIILLVLNFFWQLFSPYKLSTINFLSSILVIVGFAVFYFMVKNIKRYIKKKKSIKSKFLDSIVFVPIVYVCFIFSILMIIYLFSFLFEDMSYIEKQAISDRKNEFKVTKDLDDGGYLSDNAKNLILFINISTCSYASIPLVIEFSEYKDYLSQDTFSNKKSTTFSMLIISLFSAMLIQLLSIGISEKIIYKILRKKKRKTPDRKNKILIQSV